VSFRQLINAKGRKNHARPGTRNKDSRRRAADIRGTRNRKEHKRRGNRENRKKLYDSKGNRSSQPKTEIRDPERNRRGLEAYTPFPNIAAKDKEGRGTQVSSPPSPSRN